MLILGKDLQVGQFVFAPVEPALLQACTTIADVEKEKHLCVVMADPEEKTNVLSELANYEFYVVIKPDRQYFTLWPESLNEASQLVRAKANDTLQKANDANKAALAFLDTVDGYTKQLFVQDSLPI